MLQMWPAAHSQYFRVEQKLLPRRLNYVEAGYDLDDRWMEGTRESILNQTVAWAARSDGRDDGPQTNTGWFYGSPGIDKMSLAHSIGSSLHDQRQLAGAFSVGEMTPI